MKVFRFVFCSAGCVERDRFWFQLAFMFGSDVDFNLFVGFTFDGMFRENRICIILTFCRTFLIV